MGLIAATAFILALQEFPDVKDTHWAMDVDGKVVSYDPNARVSQDRINEIWDHVDNRIIRQLDLWFEDGEFPPSVDLLRIQYAYSPDDYDTATNLGWMLENTDRLVEARATYSDYMNVHPTDGDAAFPLGMSYYLKKEHENAIKYLEPSLKNNPGPNTYRVLAKCYERIKKYSDAIRIWELELKRFPGEPTAIANIKRVKAKMGTGGAKK